MSSLNPCNNPVKMVQLSSHFIKREMMAELGEIIGLGHRASKWGSQDLNLSLFDLKALALDNSAHFYARHIMGAR